LLLCLRIFPLLIRVEGNLQINYPRSIPLQWSCPTIVYPSKTPHSPYAINPSLISALSLQRWTSPKADARQITPRELDFGRWAVPCPVVIESGRSDGGRFWSWSGQLVSVFDVFGGCAMTWYGLFRSTRCSSFVFANVTDVELIFVMSQPIRLGPGLCRRCQ